MRSHTYGFGIAVAALGLAVGCAPSRPPAQVSTDQSFAAYQNAEIESERQEFVEAKSKQLQDVDAEIGRLEAKLTYEASYANAPKRAEWSQRLWELRQKKEKLTAELDRAKTASPLEWRDMRGTLAVAVDTLQADANKIGVDIGRLFSSPEPRPSKLCSLNVTDAKASVVAAYNRVELTVTTSDMPALSSLRQSAQNLTQIHQYSSVVGKAGNASTVTLPVHVDYDTIAEGVRVKFTPDDPAQLPTLLSVIQTDAASLGSGGCPTTATPGA